MLFWNAKDLENKLKDFQQYYNERRVHSSIDRLTPVKKTGGYANNKLISIIIVGKPWRVAYINCHLLFAWISHGTGRYPR